MIQYLQGDATQPQTNGPAIIAHVCNDAGLWGRGFVLAVSRRWRGPETVYRRWFKALKAADDALGATQLIHVSRRLYVYNMVAQHGIRQAGGPPPIRYPVLRDCLGKLRSNAEQMGATVHMPRIGCGLAGGDWTKVEPLIQSELSNHGIHVFVYDFPG